MCPLLSVRTAPRLGVPGSDRTPLAPHRVSVCVCANITLMICSSPSPHSHTHRAVEWWNTWSESELISDCSDVLFVNFCFIWTQRVDSSILCFCFFVFVFLKTKILASASSSQFVINKSKSNKKISCNRCNLSQYWYYIVTSPGPASSLNWKKKKTVPVVLLCVSVCVSGEVSRVCLKLTQGRCGAWTSAAMDRR